MDNTRISVVIPTYNRPVLLKRAIRSVLSQANISLDVEIVVIDDCSILPVDLSEFSQEPVRYFRLETNGGPQIARNKGIALASGDWILMLDDDDELLPGVLGPAVSRVIEVKNYEKFPVFFFATTNGSIAEPFMLVEPQDMMDNKLSGDFTPIFQRHLFMRNGLGYLDYPEITGVGCELLTWLDISSRFSMPSFNDILVQVNQDAPMRLTSYQNFIKNSHKFALQQDITLDFVRRRSLDTLSPRFMQKKTMGAAIYYLVSGKKNLCRERLRTLKAGRQLLKRLIMLLSYFPVFIPRYLFLKYKARFSK